VLFAACLLAAAPAAAPPPALAAPGREVPAAAGPAAEAPAPAPRVAAFPAGALYAPYLADPHSPGFGVMLVGVPEVGAAESGDLRTALKLGGSFGLLRVSSRERPERALQIEIAAGFYGQFDIDHQLDNLGWDGIYGLVATAAARPGLQLKAGVMHTSSHVGDEYAERTGRRRIGYTREEAVAGVSWQAAPRWRLYGEAAWGYLLRLEERQQPGRLQAGVERSVPAARGGRWGWYAAADLQAFEERDWRLDAALEVGLTVPAGDRRWRVGAGWYDGRLPIGEFFEDDESYLLLGLWLDL
jgi:hypothetical protein